MLKRGSMGSHQQVGGSYSMSLGYSWPPTFGFMICSPPAHLRESLPLETHTLWPDHLVRGNPKASRSLCLCRAISESIV